MVRIEFPKSMKRLRLTPEQAHQFATGIIGATIAAVHQLGFVDGVKAEQGRSSIIVPGGFDNRPGPAGRMP